MFFLFFFTVFLFDVYFHSFYRGCFFFSSSFISSILEHVLVMLLFTVSIFVLIVLYCCTSSLLSFPFARFLSSTWVLILTMFLLFDYPLLAVLYPAFLLQCVWIVIVQKRLRFIREEKVEALLAVIWSLLYRHTYLTLFVSLTFLFTFHLLFYSICYVTRRVECQEALFYWLWSISFAVVRKMGQRV